MMVTRYDMEDMEDGRVDMVERSHGDWVMWEEYNDMASEVDRLMEIIDSVLDTLGKI